MSLQLLTYVSPEWTGLCIWACLVPLGSCVLECSFMGDYLSHHLVNVSVQLPSGGIQIWGELNPLVLADNQLRDGVSSKILSYSVL